MYNLRQTTPQPKKLDINREVDYGFSHNKIEQSF